MNEPTNQNEDDGDVTVTIDYDKVSHDQLRRAFNMTFLPMVEFLNAVADGDEDLMEDALTLMQRGQFAALQVLKGDSA